MFGKHYQSMYTGSMLGAGCAVFAVWGYVIAHMKPDVVMGAQVELNPELLGFVLGAKQEEIEKAIRKLCAPDPKSRTKEEDGRRMVKIGEFDYRVVNGKKYLEIRTEEERREANRLRQAKFRAAHTGKLQVHAEKPGERAENEEEAPKFFSDGTPVPDLPTHGEDQ